MAIGDVTSAEKGSGARYNDDKPRLELIPIDTLIDLWGKNLYRFSDLAGSLESLSLWQRGDDKELEYAANCVSQYLVDAARVLTYGANKYAEWNWSKGMQWSVCVGCALRHARAILDGEELDKESGLSHYGHYLCNLIFLLHYAKHYLEGDDRPPKAIWNNKNEN